MVGLASFLAIVYPVNLRLPVHSTGAVPADLAGLRDRWEWGHAAGLVLFTGSSRSCCC